MAGRYRTAPPRPEGDRSGRPQDAPAPIAVPKPEPVKQAADPDGLSPTRYGDWERNGIAIDF